ncbi:hypothetical protein DFH06DRAFT_460199 [Mycena polygramma]|nr:hypothetical protein DFH06DRAFT_460199 [Mycena polygramma]
MDQDGDLGTTPMHIANLMISNSPPSDTERHEIQRLIDVRTKAISLLDSDIEPLVARRDALAKSARSLLLLLSATRTLPFDILGQIFHRYVELTHDPWVLSHISQQWRATAMECPDLWAYIEIDQAATHPTLRPSGYPMDKLQTLLERSRNRPLFVRFCTVARSFDPAPFSPHADRLFGALIGRSSRWSSCFLRCSPDSFPLLAQVKGKLPILRSLALEIIFEQNVAVDAFEIAPQLSSVVLGGGLDTDLSLPWSRVVRYRCDYMHWQEHIDVLERLNNMQECCLTMNNWTENEHTGLLDCPKLRRLYVNRGDMLEFIAPALEELVIEPLKMTPPSPSLLNLCGLIQRSACQLTKLCLIAAIPSTTDVPDLVVALELLPSLVELCVQSRRASETTILDTLVTSLAGLTPYLLPRLEELTFGGYFSPWSPLIATVETRRNANPAGSSMLRAFSLFHSRNQRRIPPQDLQRLNTLRSAGLDVTLIEGPGAREAMVKVPFFHAGMSDGEYWAPDTTD